MLPLRGQEAVLLAGEAADDIGLQCGGWTVSWMGQSGPAVPGTSVLDGLRAGLGERLHYEPEGEGTERFPVGLVVVAEEPYAEGMGDRHTLALTGSQLTLIARVRPRCEYLAVVLICGRPQVVTEQLPDWDAFVVAFLPGAEGAGVADVLLGDASFQGRLPFDWPLTQDDLARTPQTRMLFRVGDGLDTAASGPG